MEEKTHAPGERADSSDVVLDLNFVPQWARKPPGESHYRSRVETEEERPRRSDDRRRPRREGPPRDDQARRPRPERRERPRPPQEPVRELPVSVSFLPEQQRLASLVRQIHHSRRAYPLMDLASLLIHDPEGYLVKIEADKGAPADFRLFQCSCCKGAATSEEAMVRHVMARHLADFYDKEEILSEPPSGNFPGIARCRRTGVLLGPPNHHSYAEKLAELHQARFPNLTLDEVRRDIEVVRDEALVEQWKEESRRQTVYKARANPEAEPLDLRRAEAEFARKVPELHAAAHRVIIPAREAQTLEDRDLYHAVQAAWQKEGRFPLSMSFAMRAAFRHMHLHLFKAGKINFVTHIKPHPVRPEETVENIAEVLAFLQEHPGSTRKHLLEILHPSLDPASREAQEALQPLGWLIERGHIIEFFNGTLSVPLGRRRH